LVARCRRLRGAVRGVVFELDVLVDGGAQHPRDGASDAIRRIADLGVKRGVPIDVAYAVFGVSCDEDLGPETDADHAAARFVARWDVPAASVLCVAVSEASARRARAVGCLACALLRPAPPVVPETAPRVKRGMSWFAEGDAADAAEAEGVAEPDVCPAWARECDFVVSSLEGLQRLVYS